MSATIVRAELTVEFVQEAAESLTVHYQLTNQSHSELCVLNRLYHTDVTGQRTLDPNLAYVKFEGTDTVHITRSFIPLPPGVKVEYVDLPYITLLAAGKTLKGQAVIPLPVREFHPFAQAVRRERPESKQRERFRVYFSLGVFIKTPDVELRRPRDTEAGTYSASYGDVATRQVLLKSEVFLRRPST